MRKIVISAFLMAAAFGMSAAQPRLVVQKLDNLGQVSGSTYRLYCVLDPGQSVQVAYGDQDNPLYIRTEGELFNHEFGGPTTSAVNAALMTSVPALRYDSWLTMGFENATQNDLWELGMDYSGFTSNNQMTIDNGGWFLVPTSAKCSPDAQGLVLLGQFTTTGVVSGSLNLQGKDAANQVWQAHALTFTTADVQAFGCNDKSASNYAPHAEFTSPSACVYKTGAIQAPVAAMTVTADWTVFPNPLRENQIHIQLNDAIDPQAKASIQIVDKNGRLVWQRDLQPGDVVNNRLTIAQELSAGTYQIVWNVNGKATSKSLVVQK